MGRATDNFTVGAFTIEVSRNRLLRGEKIFALEPLVMNVLCVLAEHPGEVLSREDIINRVWKVKFGADEGLTRAISQLRKTFRKAGETERYIETIYTRGYRLDVPVMLANDRAVARVTQDEADKISLAILAFEDMSPDKDQEYFSDGVSEEIINALVRLPYLQVCGRTSSFSFKGTQTPLRDIAATLKVSHFLEGSVRKHEDKLRITVQLVEAAEDKHLWSDTFDGALNEVFDLQERIARAVEQELARIFGRESTAMPKRLADILTSNTDAYDFFVHGRALTHRQDGQNTLPKAIELLEKAVSADPKFAEAWAYLARANFYLLEHSKTPHWRDHIVAGRRALQRVFQINPNLALAHSTMAYQALLDLNVDERVAACERAYKLDPNSPIMIYTFGSALASIGQSKQGLKLMESAVSREPLSASWITGIGHPKFSLRDYDGAEDLYRRSYELGFDSALFMKAILLTHLGRSREAIDGIKKNLGRLGPLTRTFGAPLIFRNIGLAAYFGKRWWAILIMRAVTGFQVNRKKNQPSNGPSFRCFYLGRPLLFMHYVRTHPHPYLGASLAQLYTPTEEARRIRTHPEFPKFAEDIGLVRAWQQYGWPETVQPIEGTDGSNGQFTCR